MYRQVKRQSHCEALQLYLTGLLTRARKYVLSVVGNVFTRTGVPRTRTKKESPTMRLLRHLVSHPCLVLCLLTCSTSISYT
jgi:hypothetical protein